MTRKWYTIGIAATLTVVAACGSASDDAASGTPDGPSPTTSPATPTETAEPSAVDTSVDATTGDDTPGDDTPVEGDGDDDQSTSAEANDSDFSTWQNWQPGTPELGDTPPDLDAQLTWMYRSLIDLWAADDRLTTTALYGTISRTADRRAAATGMTDMLGTLSTTSADTYSLIGTAATAAAATGPSSEAYFAPRAEMAAVFETSAIGMHQQLLTLSSARSEDHYCFHGALDGDECSDGVGGAAAAVALAQLEDNNNAYRAIDIDEAEDVREADVCAAWSRAVSDAGLSDDQQLRIWVAIDDTLLDTRIVGLSECMWKLTGEEDPIIDDVVHDAALMPYLIAIADAAAAGGFTEEVYDLGGGDDDDVDEYLAISDEAARLIMTSAIEAASQTWSQVYDPELASRLYLVAGMSDSLNGDVVENLDRYELYWDGVEDMFCPAWETALQDHDGEAYETIVFSFSNLRFGDVVIPGACT